MIFKASLDKLAKGITIAVSILFVCIILFGFTFPAAAHGFSVIVVSVFLVAVYVIVYLFRPLSYEITANGLIIHRPVKNISIPLKDISSAELIGKDLLKYSIRIFGVGGMFGYYGKFSNTKLGSMTWYATRRDNPVLLVTGNNKKFILTPDEPEIFVKQFASGR